MKHLQQHTIFAGALGLLYQPSKMACRLASIKKNQSMNGVGPAKLQIQETPALTRSYGMSLKI